MIVKHRNSQTRLELYEVDAVGAEVVDVRSRVVAATAANLRQDVGWVLNMSEFFLFPYGNSERHNSHSIEAGSSDRVHDGYRVIAREAALA